MNQLTDDIPHEEMCRRILHCTIRMHFSLEDSLVNHVICQSLDRVINDIHLKKFQKDIVDSYFEENIMPEWFNKKEFFSQFRKNYNKLKHADRDNEGPKRIEYFNFNAIIMAICIYGYQKLYKKITMHSIFFTLYFLIFIHDTFDIANLEKELSKFSDLVTILRAVRAEQGNEIAWAALSNQFFAQPEVHKEIEADRSL